MTLIRSAALVLLAAASAQAGEAQDRIFRVGLLDDVAIGQSLIYTRDRQGGGAPEAAPPIEDGAVEVTVVAGVDGARVAQIELRAEGQSGSRTVLPADGGHPVMLLFLETTARTIAEATGGSPFYIRNRMREALGEEVALESVEITLDGGAVEGQAATFRPFADDPNRAAMGAFADLALTLVLSDAVPGGFARFETVTAPAEGEPAFAETLVFDRLGGE